MIKQLLNKYYLLKLYMIRISLYCHVCVGCYNVGRNTDALKPHVLFVVGFQDITNTC